MGLFDKFKKEKEEPMPVISLKPTPKDDLDAPSYFGPDGPGDKIGVPTYQYGGTNSYGQDSIFNAPKASTISANAVDESTGLSLAFLKREEDEKKRKEEEERFNQPEPVSFNPVLDSTAEKVKVETTAAETFAQYESKIDKEKLSDEAAGRAVKLTDYDRAMGRGGEAVGESAQLMKPSVVALSTDDINNNNNPMYASQEAPAKKANPYESTDLAGQNMNPLLGGGQVASLSSVSVKPNGNTQNNNPMFGN